MDNEADTLQKMKLSEQINADCPNGWARYVGTDNKCIKAFAEEKSYSHATEHCKLFKNGTLVSIHNGFQNVQVITQCSGLSGANWYWIGLNNLKNAMKYEWIDGSVLDYTNWMRNPSYNSSIYLVHMRIDDANYGKWWLSMGYDTLRYFVCMQDL